MPALAGARSTSGPSAASFARSAIVRYSSIGSAGSMICVSASKIRYPARAMGASFRAARSRRPAPTARSHARMLPRWRSHCQDVPAPRRPIGSTLARGVVLSALGPVMRTRSASVGTIYTVGHSTRTTRELLELLRPHGVEQVVDVRTIPRSRHNPQFNRPALSRSLHAAKLRYRHLKALGGLRHARAGSTNRGWRNASFRGFADYMQTEDFAAGPPPPVASSKPPPPPTTRPGAVPPPRPPPPP